MFDYRTFATKTLAASAAYRKRMEARRERIRILCEMRRKRN